MPLQSATGASSRQIKVRVLLCDRHLQVAVPLSHLQLLPPQVEHEDGINLLGTALQRLKPLPRGHNIVNGNENLLPVTNVFGEGCKGEVHQQGVAWKPACLKTTSLSVKPGGSLITSDRAQSASVILHRGMWGSGGLCRLRLNPASDLKNWQATPAALNILAPMMVIS